MEIRALEKTGQFWDTVAWRRATAQAQIKVGFWVPTPSIGFNSAEQMGSVDFRTMKAFAWSLTHLYIWP